MRTGSRGGLRGAGRIVDLRRQQHRAASSKRDINVSSASSSRAQKAIGPGHWQKSSLKVVFERHALNGLDACDEASPRAVDP
jgi:hypothetical protein